MDPQPQDATVLPNACFFGRDVKTHLSRQHLHDILASQPHWLFVIGPDCQDVLITLYTLYQERLGEAPETLQLWSVALTPILLPFPRAHLALDEIQALCHIDATLAEALDSPYFAIARQHAETLNHSIGHWLHFNHLVN